MLKEQWYQFKISHSLFFVKTKRIAPDKWVLLYLSNDNPEGMSIEIVVDRNMVYTNDSVVIQQSDVYHFGGTELGNDNIYDANIGLMVEKMKDVILSSFENRAYQLTTKEELDEVWSALENKELNFDILNFS